MEGYSSVKLYFMLGLPTETDEDLEGIIDLAGRIIDFYYKLKNEYNLQKGKGVNVTVSVSTFVPKPFTPFEFEGQDTIEEIERKQKLLISLARARSKKITLKYHNRELSHAESILARGDRRLCKVLEKVYRSGGVLESWEERFSLERWTEALKSEGLDDNFYACRKIAYDEITPWEHLDYSVSKEFLVRENKLAREAVTSPNCKDKCAGCGASALCRDAKCVCNSLK